jgi:hypothetical protein
MLEQFSIMDERYIVTKRRLAKKRRKFRQFLQLLQREGKPASDFDRQPCLSRHRVRNMEQGT